LNKAMVTGGSRVEGLELPARDAGDLGCPSLVSANTDERWVTRATVRCCGHGQRKEESSFSWVVPPHLHNHPGDRGLCSSRTRPNEIRRERAQCAFVGGSLSGESAAAATAVLGGRVLAARSAR